MNRLPKLLFPGFIFLLVQLFSTEVKAQITFSSSDEIVKTIKSLSTNKALNQWLVKNNFVSYAEMRSIVSEAPDSDSIIFTTNEIKVDVFKKSLFGNEEKEVIIQLRQPGIHSINVFYSKNNELVKVPGYIPHVDDQRKFIFYFEEIAAPSHNAIITKESGVHNRTTSESTSIWDIQPDAIRNIYSVDTEYRSYSGVFIYQYNTKRKLQFISVNDTYPKKLIVEEHTENYDHMELTQEGDTLSGTHILRSSTTEIYFKLTGKGLEVDRKKTDTQEDVFIINNRKTE